MSFTNMQGLINYIGVFGSKVIRYFNNQDLLEILSVTVPSGPDDIELIAKSLVIENTTQITIHDLYLYGLVVTILQNAERTRFSKKTYKE